MSFFIPKPDLWILLDAPPEVIQSRKQEVSFEETEMQRKAYLKLTKNFQNCIVIDASKPLTQVVIKTSKEILNHCAESKERCYENRINKRSC